MIKSEKKIKPEKIINTEKIEIKNFTYNQLEIPYIINYGKRKNIYIYIKQCKIEVKAPQNISEQKVEKFVKEKAEWIYKSVQKQSSQIKNNVKYENGEQIKILGENHTIQIEFIDKKRNHISIENKIIKIQINKEFQDSLKIKDEIKKQLEKLYLSIAQDEVEAAMIEVTNIVGLKPKEYKIKKLKRAWGNCSSKKIIAINMEVVKHNREFIKYVVLHEVCHLKHMNHSKLFWNMVEKYMPNYKTFKKLK
ncbi:MAG TPA: SprT family zinc-dependent metalloprotease [Clostridia bacterium]|nr:SprT family zinc-dependent metalloprotease [Clostridia bacterium]